MMKFFVPKKNAKKRNGFTLIEILVACLMVIGLSSAALISYSNAEQTRKVTQAHRDMEAIGSACLQYQALNKTGGLPASLDALQTGLTNAQSLDGQNHTNLLYRVNQDASLTDPWGTAYTYSSTNRTISCTPPAEGEETPATITHKF